MDGTSSTVIFATAVTVVNISSLLLHYVKKKGETNTKSVTPSTDADTSLLLHDLKQKNKKMEEELQSLKSGLEKQQRTEKNEDEDRLLEKANELIQKLQEQNRLLQAQHA